MVQGLALAAFITLLLSTEGRGHDDLGLPVRWFLDLSPLIALCTLFATWSAPPALAWSVLPLFTSLAAGRFFCGWVCPAGTLHHLASHRLRPTPPVVPASWRAGKYLFLALCLGAAAVGVQLGGSTDPLCILVRSSAVGVLPLGERVVTLVEQAAAHLPGRPLRDAAAKALGTVRRNLLPFVPPRYQGGTWVVALFAAWLLLNRVEPRFWCRYACPLGALLGATARFGRRHRRFDRSACIDCGQCSRACPGRADPGPTGPVPPDPLPTTGDSAPLPPRPPNEQRAWARQDGAQAPQARRGETPVSRSATEPSGESPVRSAIASETAIPRWLASECLQCGICERICPTGAIAFGWPEPADPTVQASASSQDQPQRSPTTAAGIDPCRRRLVLATVGGLILRPTLNIAPGPVDGGRTPSGLIRPPGALPEPQFLATCVRCGECLKVCLTNGLQPAPFSEFGLEASWTPVLVPKIGYCEYQCTLCGQVCPTGALRRLSPAEKRETKIGLAMVDRSRCLPWAHATPCIVCEELCPLPKKAIYTEEVTATTRDGRTVQLQRPVVDASLCIGCGICEAKCPVVDLPAIRVTSIGESRNPDHRLLL